MRCLECNTAVNDACRNGTKLSLNSIWLTFHLRAVHYASVSLCTQQKIYSSTCMVMEERAAQVPFVMMMWPKESSMWPSSKMLSVVCSCKRCRVWSHHPCPWKSPQCHSAHSATWNQRLVACNFLLAVAGKRSHIVSWRSCCLTGVLMVLKS